MTRRPLVLDPGTRDAITSIVDEAMRDVRLMGNRCFLLEAAVRVLQRHELLEDWAREIARAEAESAAEPRPSASVPGGER